MALGFRMSVIAGAQPQPTGLNLADWLSAGSTTAHPINPSSYSTFADVEADEEVVRQLMTVHNAVDYLATSDGTDELIGQVINSDICAKWINLRDYALDTLSANASVKALMDTADKYGYGEWALMPQVPKMTSNTAPYGAALTSSEYDSSHSAYKAFDSNSSTSWDPSASDSFGNCYIGYQFMQPTVINKIKFITPVTSGITRIQHFKFQGAQDTTNWTDLIEINDRADGETLYDVPNTTAYKNYRILIISGSSGAVIRNVTVTELQFYAWQPKGNVPIMTSNTAPYGEASASSAYSGYPAYYAFNGSLEYWSSSASGTTDYIQYKFVNPVNVRRISIMRYVENNTGFSTFTLSAGNDASSLQTIGTYTLADVADYTTQEVDIQNDEYYLIYRLTSTEPSGKYSAIRQLQFYGRELSISVPTMTSNTAPYGEAISSGEAGTSSAAWMAFDADKTPSKQWTGTTAQSATNIWVGYHFTLPVKVKRITLSLESTRITSCSYKFQGSNDGTTWEDITTTYTDATLTTFDASNDGTYKYYRLFFASQTTGSSYWGAGRVNDLQFYGLDYSEREFAEGSTMKYIYDHGVELEELTTNVTGNQQVIKGTNDFSVIGGTTSGNCVIGMLNAVDMTAYSLARLAIRDFYSDDTTYNNPSLTINANPISSTPSVVATKGLRTATAEMPNNINLDTSSVTGNNYLCVGTFGNNKTFNMSVEEWWLE